MGHPRRVRPFAKSAKDGPPAVISSAVNFGVGGEASALGLPHVDDDGFGEAVLGAHAIFAPEILQKSEAAFEHGGSLAEGGLGFLQYFWRRHCLPDVLRRRQGPLPTGTELVHRGAPP